MSSSAPTYDLVLLLDPQAEDGSRAKIVSDIREAISTQGELVRHDEWGTRVMAYQIDHKPAAEYHLLQFQAATTELIDGLSRTLHITDGIMRYRINKLKPGTPEAPNLAGERAAAVPDGGAVSQADAPRAVPDGGAVSQADAPRAAAPPAEPPPATEDVPPPADQGAPATSGEPA
jgi:small subunit ribosomal protein S6